MAASKLGTILKDARTAAGLTQEQLARKIPGVSAADISKAERGELMLTQDQLKLLAKATGVTQKSLLDAAKAEKAGSAKPSTSSSASKTSSAKTSSAKTSSAKTSSAKTASAKTSSAKTSSTKTGSAKTSSAKTSSAKTSSAKTDASKTPKTPANANSTMKVTAAERKLVEAYRTASSAQKKAGLKVLKGEADAQLDAINGSSTAANVAGDLIQNAISGLADSIFGGKK